MNWEDTIKKRKRITEDYQFGSLLDEFTGMRDSLIKELQELDLDAFDAETDGANLELALTNLGKIIGDFKYAYNMQFGKDYYDIDRRRPA